MSSPLQNPSVPRTPDATLANPVTHIQPKHPGPRFGELMVQELDRNPQLLQLGKSLLHKRQTGQTDLDSLLSDPPLISMVNDVVGRVVGQVVREGEVWESFSDYSNILQPVFENPIGAVQPGGGVFVVYFEFDVGGGLGYGLNFLYQKGVATDQVGMTWFSSNSKIYITNQNLDKGSQTPQLVIGASGSLTGNMKFNWSAETFKEMLGGSGVTLPLIPIGGDFGAGPAFAASVNNNEFSIGAGGGVGVKISVINTEIIESISLTHFEIIQHYPDSLSPFSDFVVRNQEKMTDANGKTIGFRGVLFIKSDIFGMEKNTQIILESGVKLEELKNSAGNVISTKIVSNNIWFSEDYSKLSDSIAGKQ